MQQNDDDNNNDDENEKMQANEGKGEGKSAICAQ